MHKTSRRSIAQIESIEPMLLMSATVIQGTNAGEWISGDDNDNNIFAGGGNDEIYAPLGTNTIDGGSGDDVLVVYEGLRADYAVQQLADGSVFISGRGLNDSQVNNTLLNVERILFNDGILSLNSAATEIASLSPATETPVASQPSSGGNILGTNAGEWIADTDADDVIDAGGGDDQIYAPIGRNVIDGGTGVDTLIVYEGNLSDYQLIHLDNGANRLTGPGLSGLQVINELRNVERIRFNDQLVELTDAYTPHSSPPPTTNTNNFGSVQDIPVAPNAADSADATTSYSDAFSTPQQAEPSSDFLSEVVRLTNIVRTQNGLKALSVNLQLQQAAQTQSQNLAFLDFFNHTGLDGLQPWDRAVNAGYNYQAIGENIAAGQLTPAEVVQAWVDSPSHLENILNPVFTEIGVGYQYLENDTGNINYNYYWTELFGNQR